MNFLPDVYVTCDVCRGRRYNYETLEVKYKGYSIADMLGATVEEAFGVLSSIPLIAAKLKTLNDVGLGYIHLGQSSTTLSGGEAQRIKLAKELSRKQTGRTFYLLDEPTTGLHFDDVRKLLDVLQRLVELGNTVLVIEHNLDVIKTADWVIDLGPDGGEYGGRVVATGTPEEVSRVKKSYTGQALAAAFGKSRQLERIKGQIA
jgi:excinuclease ABC subunit A